MKGKMVRAILIDAEAQTINEVVIESNLKAIYAQLQCGTIDVVKLPNGDALYVDDEGLLASPTMFYQYDPLKQPLATRGLIVGTTDEGEDDDALTTLEHVRSQTIFLDRNGIKLALRAEAIQVEELRRQGVIIGGTMAGALSSEDEE